MSEYERAYAFLRASQERCVDRVERLPWGVVLLSPSLPLVWDANFLVVDRWDGAAADLAAEADRVQGAAGHAHRKVVIPDEALAARLWPELPPPGWSVRSRYMFMALRREPDRAAPGAEVVELSAAEYEAVHDRGLRAYPQTSDESVAAQLHELARRAGRALGARRFAALADGEPAAYASLYPPREGVAQVEDVLTFEEHRGRGLARALVLHAAAEARRAGAELVFLIADDADWPKELYARLGFDPIGLETMTLRFP